MSWLCCVTCIKSKQKLEKKSSIPVYFVNRSSWWKKTPDADKTHHDKWWDITEAHNRWVRLDVKTYEISSTKIGLRFYKSKLWGRSKVPWKPSFFQNFATLLRFGEKYETEVFAIDVRKNFHERYKLH